jgi:pimeloyl-ACP methyl ester carboxylesterase
LAYDWRKPLLSSADRFCELIKAEFERRRTAISVVAHSMGGLAVRCALMRHGVRLWPKIDRIVFIGTPHYGPPVIASYLVEHFWGFNLLALLGRYISRQAFRSMWGVLGRRSVCIPGPGGSTANRDIPVPISICTGLPSIA